VVEGPGLNQVWRERVSKQLGIEAENVSFMPLDTNIVPDSGPSTLSRNLTVITRLLDNCAKAINRRRFHHGLPLEASRSFRTAESAASREADPKRDSVAAAVVEVELDTATLRFSIRGIWVAVRAGQVLRQEHARRRMELAILDSLRWTGGAVIRQKRGEESPAPFGDFRHARSVAVDHISIEFLPDEEGARPRGIGELAYLTVPSAVAAAVTQASNHYVDAIPITPELLHAYEEAE
jgi:CO/xanthine dehydrogenase Mo-binding subunit